MIVLSALHALLVGALVSGVVFLAAHLFRARNRDERWIWAAGLVGAVVLPPILRRLPTPSSIVPVDSATGSMGQGSPLLAELPGMVTGPVAASPDWLSPLLLGLWALMSGLLALRLLLGLASLRRLRAGARAKGRADGPLLHTDDVGPAIVGFLRPVILVPDWVFRLPRRYRNWIVRHEVEHLRGRDPLLLGLILVSRVAVPWNPFVWLLSRRLRTGIEIDCDRRTLSRPSSELQTYAEALLRVSRGPVTPISAASFAFAEPRLPLERRIRAMTTPRRSIPRTLRMALAGLVVLVLAVACELPAPDASDEAAPESEAASTETETDASLQEEPVFTPFTERPRVRNREEVRQALRDAYPAELREAGIGGQAIVWFFIDPEGEVQEVRLNQETGHPELDRAALEVARMFQFEPGKNRGEPVPVWVRFPISFRAP